MDSSQFDQLTRTLAGALSRRLAVGAALSGTMAAFFRLDDAEAKKKKKKKKKKKGKGQPAAPCAVNGNAVSVVAEGVYKKKPLRLQQDSNVENGTSRTEILYAGSPVVQITTEIGASAVVATVTYGGPFAGLGQMRFATNEQGTTGEIGGRAIVPLPLGANFGQMAFADGGPPLDVSGDPGLAAAIQGLYSRAGDQASSCNVARLSASTRDTSSSIECIATQAKCGLDALSCMKSVVETASSICNVVPVIGPAVCGVGGSAYCAYDAAKCARKAKYGDVCCPVRCGGVYEDIFGLDPACCEKNWTCRDRNSNQGDACCPPGQSTCGNGCCDTGSCAGGICCGTGVGVKCGNTCCGPFASCCGGRCCGGVCNGTICCIGNETPCGSGCCNGTCCNGNCCPRGQICCSGICCPSGADCRNGQCVAACPFGQLPCAGDCCNVGAGEDCQPCPNGPPICSTGLCVN